MAKCKGFRNFKKRGEWVELQFMAEAMRKRFNVSKPWGDSSPHDVGIEHGPRLIRVQVKSTSFRLGNGYLCAFKPNRRGGRYSTKTVDFFAGYIVPEKIWYILPSSVVLKTKGHDLMLCPVRTPKRNRYLYESYREAWPLLRVTQPGRTQDDQATGAHPPNRAKSRSRRKHSASARPSKPAAYQGMPSGMPSETSRKPTKVPAGDGTTPAIPCSNTLDVN